MNNTIREVPLAPIEIWLENYRKHGRVRGFTLDKDCLRAIEEYIKESEKGCIIFSKEGWEHHLEEIERKRQEWVEEGAQIALNAIYPLSERTDDDIDTAVSNVLAHLKEQS